jgi:hypothetical protein
MRCSTPELLRLPGSVSRKVIGDGRRLGKHAGIAWKCAGVSRADGGLVHAHGVGAPEEFRPEAGALATLRLRGRLPARRWSVDHCCGWDGSGFGLGFTRLSCTRTRIPKMMRRLRCRRGGPAYGHGGGRGGRRRQGGGAWSPTVGRVRKDGGGKAAVIGQSLSGRTGNAAGPIAVSLNQGQEYGIRLLDRHRRIDPAHEGFHRLACIGRPVTVELAVVAANAPELPLQRARQLAWRRWPRGRRDGRLGGSLLALGDSDDHRGNLGCLRLGRRNVRRIRPPPFVRRRRCEVAVVAGLPHGLAICAKPRLHREPGAKDCRACQHEKVAACLAHVSPMCSRMSSCVLVFLLAGPALGERAPGLALCHRP